MSWGQDLEWDLCHLNVWTRWKWGLWFCFFLCSRLMPRVCTNFLFFFSSTSCKWPHFKLLFWKSSLKGAAVPQHSRCGLREPASRGARWTRSFDSSAPGGCRAQRHSGWGMRNSARIGYEPLPKLLIYTFLILDTRFFFFLIVNTSSQGLIWRVNDAYQDVSYLCGFNWLFPR